MLRCHPVVIAAALMVASASGARRLDVSQVTCRAFPTFCQANMASMRMFLRGYHSGNRGVTPYDLHDPYAGRLGVYGRQHPDANLIAASENILSELDRGS